MRRWAAVLAAAVVLLMAAGGGSAEVPDDPPDIQAATGNFWVNQSWDSSWSGWYLISGDGYGTFNGFRWAGSAWQSDSWIVSGLGDVGGYSVPNVFEKDGTWYLISGENGGGFYGFNWTGSAWQSDSGIASGLGAIVGAPTPTVFQKDGTWYLISGSYPGGFYGFNWTGSAWQSDSGIASGLGDIGGFSTPTVFQKDGTWYLISGEDSGVFYGFNWTGSAWQSDSGIVGGLGDVGTAAVPTVFQKGGTWYLVAGAHYVAFGGFNWTGSAWQSDSGIVSGLSTSIPFASPTIFDWGTGNGTDSHNVSVNGVWHNTSPAYYNDTYSAHAWQNITAYSWNTAGAGNLSVNGASQNTQIPNNPVTITNTSDWSGDVGNSVYVDYDATDLDSDTPTFSCSRMDLFTDFNTATGTGHCITPPGVVSVDFGVSDGYGSTDNYTMTLVSTTSRPAAPDIFHSESGNFWVRHSWGSERYCISGVDYGDFYGFNWTGSAWQSDSAIVGGLGNMGWNAAPHTFQRGDGMWYLISGRTTWEVGASGVTYTNSFRGYNWTGSAWQSDTGIVDGLAHGTGTGGSHRYRPTTFLKHGVRYLISGQISGTFLGYRWNGSAWQSDSNITSGLSDVGGRSSPTVFLKDGTWYLISGAEGGAFSGYRWDGSVWQSNSGITSGLGDVGGGSSPTVFRNNGAWYLVSGQQSGVFSGYRWDGSAWQSDSGITGGLGYVGDLPVLSSMVLPSSPSVIYSVTDSYNVCINGSWHNGTTDTLWNHTGLSPHNWSNITVYAYNASGDGNLSAHGSSLNMRVPNNPCIITNITDMAGRAGIDERYVDCNYVDADPTDVPTFSCSRMDLFTDFNTTTGTGHCITPPEVVSVDFGVSDGWGSTRSTTITISDLNRWRNTDFDYRQQITINNTQHGELINSYVEVILNTSQCYWCDCSDVRLVDAWTHEELDYYCDVDIGGFPNNTTSEKIYIKVPHIPSNGTATVSFYFGNITSVPNKCSGSGTLAFTENFEEFADGDFFLDNWDFSGWAGTGGVESPGGGWCFEGASPEIFFNCNGPGWVCCDAFFSPGWNANANLMYGYYGDKLVLVQPTGATISFDFYAPTFYDGDGDPHSGSVILFGCSMGCGSTTYYRDFWDSDTFAGKSVWGNGVSHAVRLNIEFGRWEGGANWASELPRIDNIVFQQNDTYMPTHTVGDVETQPPLYSSYAILYDAHQNLVQHAQATVQNTGTKEILYHWKDIDNGIIKFDLSGTYQVAVRTFDGVFIHAVAVTENNVTNITVPLHYNLDVHPQDQFGVSLTDVFCGLSEYTPLNPQALWGHSMSGSQYVPLTNCSGFAMCDLYAAKPGYADYNVTALNWTSRTAMIKDYRHDAVLEQE